MPTQTQIKNSIQNLNSEFASLEPSSIISLYEIDITNLGFSSSSQFIINLRDVQMSLPGDVATSEFNYSIIRLHNNVKLGKSVIYWNGKAYMPAPIKTEGFEAASKGVFPKPKFSLSFSDEFLFTFALFKKVVQFDQLIGAKFTRIRTFAKFLDAKNFYQLDSNNNTTNIPIVADTASIPDGFSPDSNCEFPRDIYYFDRKSSENKSFIEFEMSSSIDLDRVKLPRRKVLSYTCPWSYRGEGCLYEYSNLLNSNIHGVTSPIPNAADSSGTKAPVVAMEDDTLIRDLDAFANGIPQGDPELWAPKTEYPAGKVVYITKNNLNYYFIAKTFVPKDMPPPLATYWVADQCSKTVKGCKIRFGNNPLPFGGFYGVANYNRGGFQ